MYGVAAFCQIDSISGIVVFRNQSPRPHAQIKMPLLNSALYFKRYYCSSPFGTFE